MIDTKTILETFNFSTTIGRFVLESSEQVAEKLSLLNELATAFDLDLNVVEQKQQLAYLQYVVVALLRAETNHADISLDQAREIGLQQTQALYEKHPYLLASKDDQKSTEDGSSEPSEPKKKKEKKEKKEKPVQQVDASGLSSDEKKQASFVLYEQHKNTMETKEIVDFIASELKITQANARYYVTRVFMKAEKA